MSLSQFSAQDPGVVRSPMPHLHVASETCPTCDQPIPHDRFDEIKKRIDARQSARSAEIVARLQEQFGREKAEALEQERQQAAAVLAARVASARDEERQAAEAAINEKLADAERANKDAQDAMQARIEQAEAAKANAEQAGNALQTQLDQMRRDSETAIQKVKQDADANAVVIREEAKKQAEAAVQGRIACLERTREESEAALQARVTEANDAKAAAQQVSAGLLAQLDQMRLDGEAAITKMKLDAEAQVNAARQEITASVESEMQEKIVGVQQAKAEAEAKAQAAEQQARLLQETHDAQLTQRLQEQREILERAQAAAVNAEKSAAFEEKLKLSTKVEELQRTLENKTAEELGEGAEIDLYEVLKAEFESDRIERINKGQAGADILHVVVHNGRECGSLIYDSKNHNAWRNDFVTKLASDQMAAKAEHAILSTRKFPVGTRHLHVQDGVILAAPSRVVALVQIVRQHILQTYTLRLSNEARAQKTAELYTFITSQRCSDLFARIDTHTDDLLDMQVKEKKAHDIMWKRQGELLRCVQKVRAEISNEIETIIGTADIADDVAEANHE